MKLFLEYLIANYPKKQVESLIKENFICGLLYRLQYQKLKEMNPILKKEWIKQKYQNQLYLKIYKNIQESCLELKIPLTPLKGIWLLQNIYKKDIAMRKLSDIDLYILPKDSQQLEQILIKQQFQKIKKISWWGNQFKTEYSKTTNGIELIVEVHTKLFFHINSFQYNLLSSLEGKIVHLCGHLALQHNFTKLYWLFDIYLLLTNSNMKINWNKLILIANTLELKNSVKLTFRILKNELLLDFPKQILSYYKLNSSAWYDHYLGKDFLIKSDAESFNYHLIKLATKDKNITNIKYYLLWFKQRLLR